MPVVGHFAEKLAVVGVVDSRTARHFDNAVFAVLTRTATFAAGLSVGSKDVTLIFEVQEGPKIAVTAQDDMASATAVTAVGAAFGDVFRSVEMSRAGAALPRATHYFYIVDKV